MIVGRLLYIHLQASFPDGDVDCGGNVLWCSEWLQKSIHYKNGLYNFDERLQRCICFSDKWCKISPYTCISTKKNPI